MEQCNHIAVKHRGWQLIIDHGSLSLSFPCFPGLCSSPKQHARVNQVFAPTRGGGCMSLMDPAQLECHSFSSGLALYIIRHTLRSAGGSAGCKGFLLLFCSALTTHPSHGASCQRHWAELAWKRSAGDVQPSRAHAGMAAAISPGCSQIPQHPRWYRILLVRSTG